VALACILVLSSVTASGAEIPVAGFTSTQGCASPPTQAPIPDAATVVVDAPLMPPLQCAPKQNLLSRTCCVGPEGQSWFRADYLLWWTQGAQTVPLVTTSDVADQGVIGQPTTEVLFGGNRPFTDVQSGARLNFGWWLNCGRATGVEFDLLTLGDHGESFRYASSLDGQPLYARPFYDVYGTPGENAQLVSDPTYLRGTVNGRVDEYLHSAGVNLRLNVCCNMPCGGCCEDACCEEDCCGGCGGLGSRHAETANTRLAAYGGKLLRPLKRRHYRIDLIAGYRHYKLNDSLSVNDDLYVFADHGPLREGTTFQVRDSFRSRNEFHGGELGLVTQIYRGRWSLELLTKMAIGRNHQAVTIYGETTAHSPGDVPVTSEGGLLALDTNIGRYTQDDFVVVPQFGAEIGYQLTCRLRAYFGYNFIYWPNVARAAEQVDYTVNSSYIPQGGATPSGEARPAFVWKDSNFWAQGINLGLDLRY
jgi:hypothetical protein